MIKNHCFFQVPAFEGKDGLCLSESNAIAYYGKFFKTLLLFYATV